MAHYNHGFGCMLDDPKGDMFDRTYGVRAAGPTKKPTGNRDRFAPVIKDQRRSNACVSFSGSTALEALEFKTTGKTPPLFSPMFGWYGPRAAIGMQGVNSGCTIRDYAECAKRFGVCSEDQDPFNEVTSDDYLVRLSHRPDAAAFEEAQRHQIEESYVLPDGGFDAGYDALTRDDGHVGYGFQTAFPVYQSFMDTPSSGIVGPWLGNLAGWHAVYVIDFDIVGGIDGYWMQNSWGVNFGRGGYFFVSVQMYSRFRDSRVYSKLEVLS